MHHTRAAKKVHGEGEIFSFRLFRAVWQICSRHCSNAGNGSCDFTRSLYLDHPSYFLTRDVWCMSHWVFCSIIGRLVHCYVLKTRWTYISLFSKNTLATSHIRLYREVRHVKSHTGTWHLFQFCAPILHKTHGVMCLIGKLEHYGIWYFGLSQLRSRLVLVVM